MLWSQSYTLPVFITLNIYSILCIFLSNPAKSYKYFSLRFSPFTADLLSHTIFPTLKPFALTWSQKAWPLLSMRGAFLPSLHPCFTSVASAHLAAMWNVWTLPDLSFSHCCFLSNSLTEFLISVPVTSQFFI